jgi:hypothetical protein
VSALEAQDPESHTLPAQSPQKVFVKTICIFLKVLAISQSPLKTAIGLPQPDGSGEAPEMSEGIEPRGKKKMLMNEDVISVAYTPPLLSLKPFP